MKVSDFAEFYGIVHGHPPFPWQERLLERVVNEGWPRTISLPTSSGKTSAIDIAVFHLALEAGKSTLERRAPLRVFFVIDRRVVVDEAGEHAAKLAQALIDSKVEIVRAVADALRRFGAKHPLDVAILRGGMYRDNTWADEPNQPLVCVSTVDQVGSRLLFRGYQVSDRAKSVHAGLVGNDSLIIVDEAHLSEPFLDTLAFIEEAQRKGGGQGKSIRGMEVVRMSATLESADNDFRLEEADYENPALRKRLAAGKPAELRSPAKGFEDELVRAAEELAALPDVFITGVEVNTVAGARSVFEELRKSKDSEAILLTGRSRPHDTQKLWAEHKGKMAAKPNRVAQGRLFVVATQTVEVGANLDFDALVTESAPLDALRQRFGRLNRLGNRSEAQAVVVRRPKENPVYGESTARTWDLLIELGKVDFGVMAMDDALKGRSLEPYITERSKGPLVFSKYLEMWAQTKPAPDPDPDVAPFLHGRDALDDADIQVVWRADLLEDCSAEIWQETVEAAPPVSSEALGLPLGTLRRWLRGETKLNVADVEGANPEEQDAQKENRKKAKPVLIWRGPVDKEPLTGIRYIRPGDVVVVPASYGGCDQFGWHPESREPVEDIGDEANNVMAEKGLRNYRLRLSLYAERLDEETKANFLDLLGRLEQARGEGEDEADIRDQIGNMLRPARSNWRIHSDGGVATSPKPKQKKDEIEPSLKPEDQDDSAGLERRITLDAHTGGVVEHARKYASKCGLGGDLVEDIVLAARLHDLGKCDDRFQDWLRRCSKSPAQAARQSELLAKSDGDLTLAERRGAQIQAGYPQGARHESASVLLACASDSLVRANDRDLVLHLIGTHHGFGRPLLPFWAEEEGLTVDVKFEGEDLEASTGRELSRFDSGWIERFSRLNERYGYWGLAYLETVLRRADGMQSREEQDGE